MENERKIGFQIPFYNYQHEQLGTCNWAENNKMMRVDFVARRKRNCFLLSSVQTGMCIPRKPSTNRLGRFFVTIIYATRYNLLFAPALS